jgi:ABC-type Zn uptake system ZnuABC Zn-binding protein ZnuA
MESPMRRLVVPVLLVSLLAAACGDGATSPGGEVTAVASVYPLAWVAGRVAPDADVVAREADVELLEISPLDAVTNEQADVGFLELALNQAAQFATALGC